MKRPVTTHNPSFVLQFQTRGPDAPTAALIANLGLRLADSAVDFGRHPDERVAVAIYSYQRAADAAPHSDLVQRLARRFGVCIEGLTVAPAW